MFCVQTPPKIESSYWDDGPQNHPNFWKWAFSTVYGFIVLNKILQKQKVWTSLNNEAHADMTLLFIAQELPVKVCCTLDPLVM